MIVFEVSENWKKVQPGQIFVINEGNITVYDVTEFEKKFPNVEPSDYSFNFEIEKNSKNKKKNKKKTPHSNEPKSVGSFKTAITPDMKGIDKTIDSKDLILEKAADVMDSMVEDENHHWKNSLNVLFDN
jgi:hypothetical protein